MAAPKGNKFGEKNKGKKYTVSNRDSGRSEPRIDAKTHSCGLCGEVFADCKGHPELPGMTPTRGEGSG